MSAKKRKQEMTEAQYNLAVRAFPAEVVELKAKAGRLGLWKTLHALDKAQTEVSWEIADILKESMTAQGKGRG